MFIVYLVLNIVNGKVYIGKTSQRYWDMGYSLWNPSGSALKDAISKYGKDNFVRYILYKCEDEAESLSLERMLVHLGFVKSKGNYNLYTGGEGGKTGYNHTEQAKCSMSRTRRGRKRPDQSRFMSNFMKGRCYVKGKIGEWGNKVVIDGVVYGNSTQASKTTSIPRRTIELRVGSNNFPNYVRL